MPSWYCNTIYTVPSTVCSANIFYLSKQESFRRCFGSRFFPDPVRTFFPESGSGLAKYLDPIRKIRIRIGLFFLSLDRDWPNIWIWSGKSGSGSTKKHPKTASTSKTICLSFLEISTLSFLVRFLQNLIKEHHLDPISLLTNGSGSGFLKYGSVSAKNRIHPDPDLDPKHWF